MPPKAGNENRVSGAQVRRYGATPCVSKSRMLFQIRIVDVDQADGLSGGGEIPGANIQIGHLIGWEQREPPDTGNAAGNIGGIVKMGRYDTVVTQPQADQSRREREFKLILLAQTG